MSRHRHRDDSGRRKKWFHGANVLLGVVLLGVVVVVSQNLSEGQHFADLLHQARPEWLLVGVGAQLATYLASSAIWYRIARRHSQQRIGFWNFFALGFAKLFVDQVVPSAGIGGTIVVVRGLRKRGLSRPLATAAVLVDLVAFYVGQGLAVIAALVAVLVDPVGSGWIVAAGVVFLVIASVVPGLIFWVNHKGARSVPRVLRRIEAVRRFLATLAAAPKSVVRDVPLTLECSAWQLAVILLDAATLGAMLYGLGLHPSFAAVLAAHVLASAVASLGVLPAGLGVFEATSIATLRLLNVPLEAALAATMLSRGLMLWIPLVPGLIVTRIETRPVRAASAGHAGTPDHRHVARHAP
jgi:uncharacterized protein (TIRG00374 family)